MKKKVTSVHLIVVILAISLVAVLLLLGTASTQASAPRQVNKPLAGPPPTMVNYQGTLREGGGLYEGTGYFKFAIMDSTSGNGSSNYWAHDSTASGEPTTYITLTVTNGLFNVLLGDTSITGMTTAISDSVFAETNTYLRVWFSDSSSGFQALEPNQPFASVAYALRCTYAESATETDPVFSASAAATINSTMISNWNTAYNTYDNSRDAWMDSSPSDVYVQSRNVGIDTPAPKTLLHIQDNTALPQAQLLLEQGGPGDAYMAYLLGPTGSTFSTGYDSADGNFKTTNTNNLTGGLGSAQGDGTTMLQAHPSGILDFNNQSRARAWLSHVQVIPHAIWTKIEFDIINFDQQGEYMPFPMNPWGAFVAKEPGYYQVHARTAYEYVMLEQPQLAHPRGYVSIRIVVTSIGGLTTVVAQGNNLMMLVLGPTGDSIQMLMNNAPNVSDVVYLNPGDRVEIEAWQDIDMNILNPVSLYFGPDQTYVSIHKDS